MQIFLFNVTDTFLDRNATCNEKRILITISDVRFSGWNI